MMTTLYTEIPSPLGALLLTADDGALTGVHFPGQKHDRPPQPDWQRADDEPVLAAARAQLAEYFDGRRAGFDLPLALHGTSFQRAVWQALLSVPFGATSTYGAIAAAIGRPSAVRAVGAAIGANPIGIIVPCHRIIGRGGRLTGYAGGLDRKAKLLALEDRAARFALTA
jgi:methylated-DNA-[protein]-cysteine S-methyltransferase